MSRRIVPAHHAPEACNCGTYSSDTNRVPPWSKLMTQDEIGRVLGLSRGRVQQIEDIALAKLAIGLVRVMREEGAIV